MRTTLIITGLAAGLALAACGTEEGGAGDTTQERDRDAFLAFAKCMRAEGIDFPDPQSGENGLVRIGPGPGNEQAPPAKMRKADEKCRHHLKDVKPPELSESERADFEKAALKHAQCMRRQGLDFPDPQFDENGGASIELRRGAGLDPTDPKFRKAEEACRDEAPLGPRRAVSP